MFVVLTDDNLVTRVINTDHVVLFALTDGGHQPPYRPTVVAVLRDGTTIERLSVPIVDQPDPSTASRAVHRFFHEILEGKE